MADPSFCGTKSVLLHNKMTHQAGSSRRRPAPPDAADELGELMEDEAPPFQEDHDARDDQTSLESLRLTFHHSYAVNTDMGFKRFRVLLGLIAGNGLCPSCPSVQGSKAHRRGHFTDKSTIADIEAQQIPLANRGRDSQERTRS